MKLLYVYFSCHENCKLVFKDDIEINFDSSFRFSLERNGLNVKQCLNEIPNGFFSVLPMHRTEPIVDAVSVIVGGNGVGKTTLAKVLVDMKQESSQFSFFKAYVLVYKRHKDERFYCETNINDIHLPENVIQVSKDVFPPQGSFNHIPMVYITPHFTPYPVVDPHACSSFTDLSAIGVMGKMRERYYNPSAQEHKQISSIDPISVYQTELTKHMLSFAAGENQLPSMYKYPHEGDDPKCKPKGFIISISKVAYQKLHSEATEEMVRQILGKMSGNAGEFVVNVFYAYAGLLLHDMPIKSFKEQTGKDEDSSSVQEEKQAWDEFQKYRVKLRDFCLSVKRIQRNDIREFFKDANVYPKDSGALSAKAFFNALEELENCVAQQHDIRNAIPVSSPDNRLLIDGKHTSEYVQRVIELVGLHFKARHILSFLDFDVSPRMSSGERAFFDTWGRLYHHYRESLEFCNQNRAIAFDITNQSTWLPSKDAIVFIDEVETTMHPEWQRQLVNRTIWFFEAFAPWVHPHIIFATHSPILLSDIPRGNVIKLRRDKTTGCTVVDTDFNQSTFAANIFDLYKDSFFLDHGTMGEFAASKVDALLEKLNPKSGENETDEDYQKSLRKSWKSIGPDDLKVANLIGDPFLSRYVYRRLEALGKDADELPEDELPYDGVVDVAECNTNQKAKS